MSLMDLIGKHLRDAFYELLEGEFEDQDVEPTFDITEVAFREKPGEPETFQVILTNGQAIELQPSGDTYAVVSDENELGIVSVIYGRLVKAIEEARPDLKGDISLDTVPTLANHFLRDEDNDCFKGTFSLLSTPDTKFKFKVDIIDIHEDELTATVEPV